MDGKGSRPQAGQWVKKTSQSCNVEAFPVVLLRGRGDGRMDGKESRPQTWQRVEKTSQPCNVEAILVVLFRDWKDGRKDEKEAIRMLGSRPRKRHSLTV